MPTIPKIITSDSPTFAALIGLDWGDTSHALALQPADGPMEELTLEHSAENLHRWLQDLQVRFGGRSVALALEANSGAVLHALSAYAWLTVYLVHPVTSARYRTAFTPSGAKDDVPDARILLDLLRYHREQLRPLLPNEPLTRQLAGLVEARRAAVDTRTQFTNQLTSLLKTYYPQALALCGGELASPLALDFLSRWPDLLTLKTARPATIKTFYHRHNLRRPELLEARLEQIHGAVALTTDEAIVSVAVRQLHLLVEQLRTLQKHITGFEQAIAQNFAAHPDAALYRQLPGAGPALAPRLLVALGDERARHPDAASLQQYIGVAPVRVKSGGRQWVHWRWNAPVFLRQTLVEWAGQTVRYCGWAGEYYAVMKARGKNHQSILRALAFKWLRILWHCWQDRVAYDEARYVAAMKRRGSPYAVVTAPKKLL